MKYVFLAFFVLIASMPMQASACDMHDSQQTTQHGSHDMDHDGGAGMDTAMDCCDHDPAVPSDGCDSMFHCGVCTAGVMAFSALTINTLYKTSTRLYLPDTGEPLSSFNPPPFKPPIV